MSTSLASYLQFSLFMSLFVIFQASHVLTHTLLCLCTSYPFTESILFNIVIWHTPTYNLTHTHTHTESVRLPLTTHQDAKDLFFILPMGSECVTEHFSSRDNCAHIFALLPLDYIVSTRPRICSLMISTDPERKEGEEKEETHTY